MTQASSQIPEWVERWMAQRERDHDALQDRFNLHAERAVHSSFEEVLKEIREDLKGLNVRWLQVGGVVIGLLMTILIALVGVLFTLLRAAPAVPHT